MIRSLTRLQAYSLYEPMETLCATLPQRVGEIMGQHIPEIVAATQKMIEKNEARNYGDNRYTGAATEWPWLPGYIVKLNENNMRVSGGDCLRQCMQDAHLDLLRVPAQYPYQLSGILLSVGEKIEGAQGEKIPLSLPQTEQMISLIRRTGYDDPKWQNLVHCPDGRLAIIDTEVADSVPWIYGLHSLLEKNTLVPEARKVLVEVLRKVSPYFR